MPLEKGKFVAVVIIVKALKIRALFDVASVTINEYSCRKYIDPNGFKLTYCATLTCLCIDKETYGNKGNEKLVI